jgi:predicted  nucleic acid-binding Zn-ribbon protein
LSTLDELDRLDKEIVRAKSDKQRAEGTRSTLLDQLEKTFGAKSLEGAKRKLTKLQEDSAKTKKLLDEKYKTLTSNYAW